MVALTEAQKKRLKAHSKTQSVAHMKKMASLMRAGKSFSEAHSSATKSDAPKQKQKQSQSQRVTINVGRDVIKSKRKRRKPRESTRGGSSRVLGQFVPLPPYGMLPAPPPPNASASAFQAQAPQVVSAAGVANAFAPRPQTLVRDSVPNVVGVRNPAPPPLVPTQAGQVPSLERFFTNLPLADLPSQPALARQGSSRDLDELFPRTALNRQRSLPEVLEYENVRGATERVKRENPEIFAAAAKRPPPPAPPVAPPDFTTTSSLGDAFTGKPLSAADDVEARKMAEVMRTEAQKARPIPAGGGGGGARVTGTPLGAPAPIASKTRRPQAAEGYEGY
tara:strand:+ start:303 stop:1307 length:1005 start_codon:yes stop_codon:yes gene_type:complete